MVKRFAITAFAAFLAASSFAQFRAEAFNNATIQPSGPRSGLNGKRFFNIEGSGNAQFSSWGAADFTAASFNVPFQVGDITDFVIELTQENASFTRDGEIEFWLTTDTDTSIEPEVSPWVFLFDVEPEGVGDQTPLIFLGSGSFRQVANGTKNRFPINLSAGAEQLLIDSLNNNRNIRLVITPDEDNGPVNVAATYAGFDNSRSDGPILEFNATAGGGPLEIFPNAYRAVRGRVIGGDLASLQADDNNGLRVQKFVVINQIEAPVQVEVDGTSSISNPSSFQVDWKGRMETTGAFRVEISLRDFAANAWVDETFFSVGTTYATRTVNGTAPFDRYVGTNGLVRARYFIRQTGPAGAQLWTTNTDFVRWTIGN